jgi:hypothetical protein
VTLPPPSPSANSSIAARFEPGSIPDGLEIIVPGRPGDPAHLIRQAMEAIPEPACFEVTVFRAADDIECRAFAASLQAALEPLIRDLLEGRLPASHLTVAMGHPSRHRDERLQIRILPLEEPPPNRRERRQRGVRHGR